MFLINVLLTGTTVPWVGSGGGKIDNLAPSTFKLVSFDLVLICKRNTGDWGFNPEVMSGVLC